jgi:RimJ/RimL family protein N-acetyltransferase
MAVGDVIDGKITTLSPVVEGDAEFILSLRTDPTLSKYLNPTSSDLTLQRQWIKNQQHQNNDYYYVINYKFKKRRVGLIGLYDGTAWDAQLGRWICLDPVCALESLLLVYKFAFTLQSRGLVYLRVVKENLPVISLHKNFGAVKRDIPFERSGGFELVWYDMYRERFFEVAEKHQKTIDFFAEKANNSFAER